MRVFYYYLSPVVVRLLLSSLVATPAWSFTTLQQHQQKPCLKTTTRARIFLEPGNCVTNLYKSKEVGHENEASLDDIDGPVTSSNFQEEDDTILDDDNNDRSAGLRKALETFGQVISPSDANEQLTVGSTVVASNDLPEYNIWQFQSYELVSIYDQGMNDETGQVEKLRRTALNSPVDPPTYTRYLALSSPKYHDEPVVLEPRQVVLSSMRTEVLDSLVMGLPLFGFWTAVAISFANKYTERTGGTFLDAFWGR